MNISYLTLLLTLFLHANCVPIVYIDSKGLIHNVSDVTQIKQIEDWVAWAQYDNTINATG